MTHEHNFDNILPVPLFVRFMKRILYNASFNPDCPLALSFPPPIGVESRLQRESSNKTFHEADKTVMLSRFAGYISINWIPACAGMTKNAGMTAFFEPPCDKPKQT
jgi:hypothetical protein